MQRLRRLYEEKENARDRSVPDGSDKEVNSLTGPNYGGYAGRLRRLYAGRLRRLCAEKARDTDGSDKHRHSQH